MRILLSLLILLALLLLFAPYIASIGPVRSIVVNQINKNLSGSVAISNYSVGWTGGIKADGLKVFDANRNLVLEVPRVSTKLSLLDAIRGGRDLGDTQIDVRLNDVRIDRDGKLNLASLARSTPKTPAEEAAEAAQRNKPAKPIDVPNVKGKLTVNILGGQVSGEGLPAPITVDPGTIVLNMPGVANQPIANDVKFAYHVAGSAHPSTISAVGSIDAVRNGKLDIDLLKDTLRANQRIALGDVDLAAAQPFLKLGPDAIVGGLANGSLEVATQGFFGINAAGQIDVTNAQFSGAGVKDHVVLDRVVIPVDVTTSGADANSMLINIRKLAVESSLLNVDVSGQVPQQAISRLVDRQPPGAEGRIVLTASAPDLGRVARALPKTLDLAQGVAVTGGSVVANTAIDITRDGVNAIEKLDLAAKGTRDGKPIELKPVHLESSAVALMNGKPIPDLRDIKLSLNSAFATVNGGGQTIGNLNVDGKFDLAKLRNELVQFSDLGGLDLAGTGDFNIKTSGDPTDQNAPIKATLAANLDRVRAVGGPASQPIDISHVAISGGATLDRAAGNLTAVNDAALNIQAGDPGSPLVNVPIKASYDINKQLATFDIAKGEINNLADVQRQYGALVPALAKQNITLNSGAAYFNLAGTYDKSSGSLKLTKPLAVSLPNIVASKDGRQVFGREDITATVLGEVQRAGETTRARFTDLNVGAKSKLFSISKSGEPPIDVTLAKNGIMGNGAVALSADIKRLADLAQNFGGQPLTKDGAGQITSGKFDGVLQLAHGADAPRTDIVFDGNLSDLSITTNSNPIQNETMKITAHASSPDDFSAVNVASAGVQSKFANANVTDAVLKLGRPPLAMVERANVSVDVPNLPATYSLASALKPPAPAAPAEPGAPVLPPLAVEDGSATMKLAVKRDEANNATLVDLSDLRVSRLGIARGSRRYQFKDDIDLKTSATLSSAGEKIQNLTVQQLAGNLGGVARISMPQPITANLADPKNLAASGQVRIDGTFDELVKPLAIVQGGEKLPYRGSYVAMQTIGTKPAPGGQSVVSLVGDITASDFKVLDPASGQVSFGEKQVNIKNDIAANLESKTAMVHALTIDMPQSQALALKFAGQVTDWDANRFISAIGDDVSKAGPAQLQLSYDLQKLWPIVHPMLIKPGQEDKFQDLKIAGKYTKTYSLSGKYPANRPFNEAVKYLNADGAVTVDMLETSGLSIGALDVPFKLSKGNAVTLVAPPASCNGGTLNLSSIAVNLTGTEPRVSISKNHKLLTNATINPLLGDTLGKYVNPVFANAQRAKGNLSVTIDQCDNVALGDAMKTENSGRAHVTFSLEEMDIANPLGPQLVGALGMLGKNIGSETEAFRGEIRNATVELDRGVVNTDITFALQDPGQKLARGEKPTVYPLNFKGDVTMANLAQSLIVTIPPELCSKWFGEKVGRFLPGGLPLSLTGTTVKPNIDPGQALRAFGEAQIKAGLLGGADNKGDDQNPLGKLGDLLGGDKDKDKDKKKDDTRKDDAKKKDDGKKKR